VEPVRQRLLLGVICAALPLTSLLAIAGDSKPGPTDTATLRITFTVPERIQAAARVTSNDQEISSVCLTTLGSSAFAVNALIQQGVDWQLAPVSFRQDRSVENCDEDFSVSLDLNDSWYATNGMMTLLVSPL
jgi:hypothetical protein